MSNQTKIEKKGGITQKDGHNPQTKAGITLKRANKQALHRNNQGSFQNSLFRELIRFLFS